MARSTAFTKANLLHTVRRLCVPPSRTIHHQSATWQRLAMFFVCGRHAATANKPLQSVVHATSKYTETITRKNRNCRHALTSAARRPPLKNDRFRARRSAWKRAGGGGGVVYLASLEADPTDRRERGRKPG